MQRHGPRGTETITEQTGPAKNFSTSPPHFFSDSIKRGRWDVSSGTTYCQTFQNRNLCFMHSLAFHAVSLTARDKIKAYRLPSPPGRWRAPDHHRDSSLPDQRSAEDSATVWSSRRAQHMRKRNWNWCVWRFPSPGAGHPVFLGDGQTARGYWATDELPWPSTGGGSLFAISGIAASRWLTDDQPPYTACDDFCQAKLTATAASGWLGNVGFQPTQFSVTCAVWLLAT